jgi:hypothetical protein
MREQAEHVFVTPEETAAERLRLDALKSYDAA